MQAIERAGWSVWWDREIGAGAAFDRTIEQAIDAARCIVVVWSASAIDSEWVRAEAHEALERGVLVPVSFDGVRPPLAFRRMQTIALDADAASSDAGLDQIKRAIAALAPIRDDQPGGNLARGREAQQRHEWESAYELLAACDSRQPLGPEDLERLSWAAFWTARYAETLAMLERAEAGFRKQGDVRGAARTAIHQSRLHAEHRNPAIAEGIFRSAGQLIANEPECAEQGQFACQTAHYLLAQAKPTAARAQAERARDIGRRVRDRNVEAMALLWLGNVDMYEGRASEGIALHDQATAAATSGALDPYYSGFIYCNVIVGCRNRADWHRAAEWTERADRWGERESVGFFPGVCRVHRAEVLRFRGALRDAERDVLQGCEQLAAASPAHSVQAFRELAEVRLRLGDLAGAEAACRQVVQLGREPQPVLARLRLATGDIAGALASIERALTDVSPWHRQTTRICCRQKCRSRSLRSRSMSPQRRSRNSRRSRPDSARRYPPRRPPARAASSTLPRAEAHRPSRTCGGRSRHGSRNARLTKRPARNACLQERTNMKAMSAPRHLSSSPR